MFNGLSCFVLEYNYTNMQYSTYIASEHTYLEKESKTT